MFNKHGVHVNHLFFRHLKVKLRCHMFKYADQPLSISKIWKSGFSLYKTTLTKIWYLALILEIIITGNLIIINSFFSKTALQTYPRITIALGIVALVVVLLIGVYFHQLPLHRIHQLATTPNEPLKNSFKIARQKYWIYALNITYFFLICLAMIVASIIIVLSVFLIVSLLLLLIKIFAPAFVTWLLNSKIPLITLVTIFALPLSILLYCAYIIAALSFAFNLPLILFENSSAWSAIKTGLKLVWGKCWHILLGVFLPIFVISIPLTLSYFLWMLYPQNKVFLEIYFITSIIMGTFLLIPLYWSLILVQFNDLKLRKKIAAIDSPAKPNA